MKPSVKSSIRQMGALQLTIMGPGFHPGHLIGVDAFTQQELTMSLSHVAQYCFYSKFQLVQLVLPVSDSQTLYCSNPWVHTVAELLKALTKVPKPQV